MEIAALSAVLAGPASVPVAPTAPSQLVTERFNAMMAAPEVTAPVAGVPAGASLVSSLPAVPAEASPTLGNHILSSLRASAGEFSEKWQGVAHGLDAMGTQPHMADLLRLQTNLVQAAVQYELVGKAVSRSTQNVDALVRMS